jgi:hypothetical protein
MLIAWWLNVLGLAFAAGLGVRALLDPQWAARFVRMKDDGLAEFRAVGGVLVFAHVAALVLTWKYVQGGEHVVGLAATGAAAALAAAWGGAAMGRCLSMWRDAARTRFQLIRAGMEAALALAIGAPWAVWFLSPPG